MDRSISTAIIVAVILLALALMLVGWRRRAGRQADIGTPRPVPAEIGEASIRVPVLYVATTRADAPLDRVAVHGLGFRARGEISVHPEGAVVAVDGREPWLVTREDTRGSGRATWTIDRVVEEGGLVLLAWTLGGAEVDSYFRVTDASDVDATDELLAALATLAPSIPPPDAPESSAPESSAHARPDRKAPLVTHAPAYLVLEDGTRYRGRAYGARGRALGEAVFATGMSGYQETLTDPSYAGQIVVQTAPHIGNTGMNDEDPESRRIWVDGYVVRDPSRIVSNHRAVRSLDDELEAQGIVGISGIDTRALTRRLRDAGVMRAGIFSGDDAALDADTQLAEVRASAAMSGRSLSAEVSVDEAMVVPAVGESIGRLAVLDLGVKASTLRHLSERGFEVHVLPQSTTIDELRGLGPVAVFYSNGPGDPAASDAHVSLLQDVLRDGMPFFGICFGNQLLGRALGFGTYKLPFGHRGINQPVLDKQTGRVEITAHNHGFAVDAPVEGVVDSPAGFGRVEVSHVGLNDQVVEGLRALDIPAFSVQYHPEAAAGPHDSTYLFDRFRAMVSDALLKEKGTDVPFDGSDSLPRATQNNQNEGTN